MSHPNLGVSVQSLKKKRYCTLQPVGDEKKSHPASAPETNPYFFWPKVSLKQRVPSTIIRVSVQLMICFP